MLAQGFESNV